MNDFNVLLAAATNGTPSGSLFDALFARYIAPQESWRELESPLPITILAAGEDLIDYRIYGNTENGESAGERTVQLFDIGNAEANKYIDVNTGEVKNVSTGGYMLSDYIDVSDMDAVVMSSTVGANTSGSGGHLNLYDASKNWMRGMSTYQASPANTKKVFSTDVSNASYVRVDYATDFLLQNSLIEGSTAPTSYIPYGYKLPMVVTNGTTTATTPIYIGSDPLAEDEYVDFGKQKIYRMVNGTLTPTDPPAPIPALPTIQGKTIIDYNPSTTPAVEPEKMYVKYKPR